MGSFFDGLFSRGAIPTLEKVLEFSEAKHRVLLANIANAETPGYRRRDISTEAFDLALKDAILRQQKNPAEGFQLDMEPLVRESAERGTRLRILDRSSSSDAGVLRHDGNNVDIEKEMAVLFKNSGRLRKASGLLRKFYGQIRAAVEGR